MAIIITVMMIGQVQSELQFWVKFEPEKLTPAKGYQGCANTEIMLGSGPLR